MDRYIAKEEAFSEGAETGRILGMWNEKLLPIQWEAVKVEPKDAHRIRRVYRRLEKRKSSRSLRRLMVFVRHENVVRLLELLGYRTE